MSTPYNLGVDTMTPVSYTQKSVGQPALRKKCLLEKVKCTVSNKADTGHICANQPISNHVSVGTKVLNLGVVT